jgi:anaerobic magnesium-protoporphyrin IX monomethyl ester cyclase
MTGKGYSPRDATAKFDEELARACKRSGCYEIASGIESGSSNILRNIRKPATTGINRRFIITAKRAGIRVKAFMIIGLPGESWETIRD